MVMVLNDFTYLVRNAGCFQHLRTHDPVPAHVSIYPLKINFVQDTDLFPAGRVLRKNPATAFLIAPVAKQCLMRASPCTYWCRNALDDSRSMKVRYTPVPIRFSNCRTSRSEVRQENAEGQKTRSTRRTIRFFDRAGGSSTQAVEEL